jgi:hypothetical protein
VSYEYAVILELQQADVSYEDAVILELQQAAAIARASLESEKKQIEGELPFLSFACWLNSLGIRSQLGLYLCF